jgi:hypothetical protein
MNAWADGLRRSYAMRMMKGNLIAGAIALTMAVAAQANTFTFVTPSGSTDPAGEPVDAQAVLMTGTGSLSIALSNLLTASQMKSAGQLISDLSFTLTGVTSTGSVTSSTATFVNVAADGTPSMATVTGTDQVGWKFSNSGSTYTLDGLAGTATPAHTIIGGTAGDFTTAYSGANASIAGNGPHNPFAQGTADWVLSIPGLTDTTSISSVVFSFTTASGVDVTGVPKTGGVPEPATLGLLGLGLAGLGLARRKNKS